MNEHQDKDHSTTAPAMSNPSVTAAMSGQGSGQSPQGSSADTRIPASTTPAAAKPLPKTESGRTAIYFRALLSLVLVTGMLVLAFFAREQQQALNVLFGDYNSLNRTRDDVVAQMSALEAAQLTLQQTQLQLNTALQEQIREAELVITAQSAQIDALNRDLVATRMRITDSGAGASQAWMLTEAESLMRFAQQRLLLARDVRSAIGLDISADDLLKQFNDPAVFSVREELANDLAILQGVREVDVQNLYLQAGVQIARIQDLSVKSVGEKPDTSIPEPEPVTDEPVTDEPVSDEPGWWDDIGSKLGEYFVVTRGEEAVIPVLTPEQAWLLKQNQVLLLEQARVALLKGQQETWQIALDAAILGINTNLDGEGKTAVLNALNNLRATSIVTSIPPASNGLAAIRRILPQAIVTETAAP